MSPVFRKFKSQSLAKPSRNCSDASPTSVLSGGLAVKETQVVAVTSAQLRPSLGRGTLHLCPAAAPRTGLPLSQQPPKMYTPLAASLHTAVCLPRAVGAVPLKVTSDHVAACRQRGWKRSFGARFGEFCLDSECQKPLKILCKN